MTRRRRFHRTGYVGSVVVGSRKVWSSPVQDTRTDAERYARGMTKSYTYEGGKSRTGLAVRVTVRKV